VDAAGEDAAVMGSDDEAAAAAGAGPSAPSTPRPAAVTAAAEDTQQQQQQHAAVRSTDAPSKQQHRSSSSKSSSSKAHVPSPAVRQQLLAFAACHCPASDLPPLTDELLLAQQQQQQQQGEKVDAAVTPRPNTPLLETTQQLQLAAAAAATAGNALTSIPTLGDPALLLGLLLRQQSGAAAQQVLDEQVIGVHLGVVGRCYSSLQRVLAVGAAAQLLLALQQPGAAAVLDAAGMDLTSTGNDSSSTSSSVKAGGAGEKSRSDGSAKYFEGLPKRKHQLQALLRQPLRQLQAMVDSVAQQQQQQQQQEGTGNNEEAGLAAAAAAAAQASSCASGLLLRLQHVADGRQMRQWLPDADTARFMAGEHQAQLALLGISVLVVGHIYLCLQDACMLIPHASWLVSAEHKCTSAFFVRVTLCDTLCKPHAA
jgi:hypothetical protein